MPALLFGSVCGPPYRRVKLLSVRHMLANAGTYAPPFNRVLRFFVLPMTAA
jgi:hypothetical protein